MSTPKAPRSSVQTRLLHNIHSNYRLRPLAGLFPSPQPSRGARPCWRVASAAHCRLQAVDLTLTGVPLPQPNRRKPSVQRLSSQPAGLLDRVPA
ncbi:hypothetical protein BD289DRAFT_448941 [Coniella lustricola]|uniref:Uncharacterized protein n=1 Tax=Coniella lustricola TaxID=2025994 RepID=A0A2T2ZRP8_9PEZI|nr:hypothetical protein BD289DRAFT_448941 [Coniella lustricola]